MLRIGMGIDVHPFKEGRDLWIGCVKIPHERGLEGHSDADVLVHAIVDAILGALGKRDIGFFYPADKPEWKGYPGSRFLEDMRVFLAAEGWSIENIDSVIVAEEPRFAPYIPAMVARMAQILDIGPGRFGVKATTTEKLGFTGRGEGICAQAVVLLRSSRLDESHL